MTGSAGRPNGSHGAPDGRSGREPESASFEIARVSSRRASPPIVILGFLATVGAIVAVGVGGGASSAPTLRPVAIDAAAATPAPIEPAVASPTAPVLRLGPGVGAGEDFDSGPGQIRLKAHRLPASMYVHGDVFVPQVTWVFVTLHDELGNVAGWTSVSVPGAAGPARGSGPSLRFDVEMTVPDGFADRLWLDANAYDASGSQIASVRLEVTAFDAKSRFEH